MTFDAKPLPFDPSRIKGTSEKLLASHSENNYGGAVKRLNAIEAQLASLDWPNAPSFGDLFQAAGLRGTSGGHGGQMLIWHAMSSAPSLYLSWQALASQYHDPGRLIGHSPSG